MRRDSGIFLLAVCAAFGQPAPAKLVTFDIAAVGAHGHAIPDLSTNEIELFAVECHATACHKFAERAKRTPFREGVFT